MGESAAERVAVIGAGVIGAAVALALSQEGRRVLLIDRDDQGGGGASFGNVGHIAAELVQPLPCLGLLFGFWRELFALGGPLDIPRHRLRSFLPWAARFAAASFRRTAHTRHLAPLVTPAAATFERWLGALERRDLLRCSGHYEIWVDRKARQRADAQARAMARLDIPTRPAPADLLETVRCAAQAIHVAGLLFPGSAHVVDPLELVRAFITGATQRGATVRRAEVRALSAHGGRIELHTDAGMVEAGMAIVCAGAWSAPLLTAFGLRVPLEAAHGYHVELRGQAPFAEAPILYANERVLVTPMSSRLRASSFMEFSGVDACADPRKPARLRAILRRLGYACGAAGPSWHGPRPVLPDYLPGIGRVSGLPNVLYALGHQHIGLTLAPVTAELVADLVARRMPRHDISAFDLQRFGRAWWTKRS